MESLAKRKPFPLVLDEYDGLKLVEQPAEDDVVIGVASPVIVTEPDKFAHARLFDPSRAGSERVGAELGFSYEANRAETHFIGIFSTPSRTAEASLTIDMAAGPALQDADDHRFFVFAQTFGLGNLWQHYLTEVPDGTPRQYKDVVGQREGQLILFALQELLAKPIPEA